MPLLLLCYVRIPFDERGRARRAASGIREDDVRGGEIATGGDDHIAAHSRLGQTDMAQCPLQLHNHRVRAPAFQLLKRVVCASSSVSVADSSQPLVDTLRTSECQSAKSLGPAHRLVVA